MYYYRLWRGNDLCKKVRLAKFFNEIEEKIVVKEWKIDELKVWPIIRNEIIFNTMSNFLKGFNFLNEVTNQVRKDSFNFEKLQKSDVIILSNSLYNQFIDDIGYDRFFSGIIDSLKYNNINTLFLSRTFSDNKGTLYQKYLDIEPYIKNVFKSKKFRKIGSIRLEGYDDFINMIKEFNKTHNFEIVTLTKEEIIKIYNQIINLSLFFRKVIKKTNSKVFIYPCYYGNIGYAINLACHHVGINSIEIQHGSINNEIMYYGFNKKNDIKYEVFPNYFWGWHKDIMPESINCNKIEIKDRFIYGGNTWFAFWNRKLRNSNLKVKKNINDINIIFTQQAGIKTFFLEALKKSPSNYKWFIRFHPRLVKSERDDLIKKIKLYNKNVEFEISNSISLLDLLIEMDVHVTEFSSSFNEATLMNVPSIIIDHYGENMYSNSEGYYKSAYNSKDLLSCIVELEKYPKKLVYNNKDIEDIFSKGIERLIKLIDDTYSEVREISYIDYIQNVFEYKLEKTNEELKEKINKLQHIGDNNSLYFIGKYNYLIGEYKKAAENLKKYMRIERNTLTNIGYVLDSILLYNEIDEKYITESFETYEILEKIVDNNKYSIESIFHSLFNNKKYKYILNLSKFCDENKLAYLYIARTYKEFKDYEKAINYFLKFIKFLREEDINYKNILSVYFHLAETYYFCRNYENAKKYFLKCEELTGGYHMKAKEYLDKII